MTVQTNSKSIVLAVLLIGVVSKSSSPAQDVAVKGDNDGALLQLHVGGTNDRVIVDLVGNRPLDGVIEVIEGSRPRIFVDLAGVMPKVDAVTEVGRGGVQRIRVALYQARPPVTRVVFDLEGTPTYRLEPGATSLALQITVETNTPSHPNPPSQYSHWFTRTTETLARLLESGKQASPPDPVAAESMELQWDVVYEEIKVMTPPPPFKAVHPLLLECASLGRTAAQKITTSELPSANIRSAQAGAMLLLRQASKLMESHLAAVPIPE